MKSLPLALLSLIPFAASASLFTFSDTEFSDFDWSANVLPSGTGVTPSQAPTGGNPGAYRQLIENAGGLFTVGDVGKNFVYVPSIDGPVSSISFSFDYFNINAASGVAIEHGLLITQLDHYYLADVVSHLGGGGWITDSGSGLTASDFTEVGGAAHPDLSLPFTFGYSATTVAGGPTVTVSGVDNYLVTVSTTSVPEPSMLAWAAVTATGLLGWAGLRRRH